MTKQEYLERLERSLIRSLIRSHRTSRKLFLKERAAEKGYAVDNHVMCGQTESDFFFFALDDLTEANKCQSGFYICDYKHVREQVTGLDRACSVLDRLTDLSEGEA